MIYNTDEKVYLLVKAFEERTLLKSEWTHAAHLIVGLYYCCNYPFGVAKNLMRDGIYWLNDAHKTPNTDTSGYHETLTMFWLKTVENFLEENKAERNLSVLAEKLIEKYKNSRLPLDIYSRDLLFSAKARQQFVEPDLLKNNSILSAPILSI